MGVSPEENARFQQSMIAYLGREKAVLFVQFLKLLGIDLKNEANAIACMTNTEAFPALIELGKTMLPEILIQSSKEIDEYEEKLERVSEILLVEAMTAMAGSISMASDFMKDHQKIGIDLRSNEKRGVVLARPATIRMLFVFWGLGITKKAIGLAETILQGKQQ